MFPAHAARRGAVSVLAAFLMVFLLMVVAFATELGYILVVRTQLQSAADSAALAAAASLRDGTAKAAQSADKYGEYNIAGGGNVSVEEDDVEMGHWSKDGIWTPEAQLGDKKVNAVRVTCQMTTSQGNPLGLNLARIIGFTHVNLSATATARIKPPPCSKIVGLQGVTFAGTAYTDSYDSTIGPYTAGSTTGNGTVCTNDSILMSGSTVIDGNAHHGDGEFDGVSGSGTITGVTSELEEELSYPPVDFGNVAANNDNANIPLTSWGWQAVWGDAFYLFSGDSVTLPPGTYYFSTMDVDEGATLNVSGEVVIYTSDDVTLSGGMVNSSANPSNLQIYSTGDIEILGPTDFYGMLYAPTGDIELGGAADFFGLVIGRQLSLSGSGGIHADEGIGQVKGVRYQSILVE